MSTDQFRLLRETKPTQSIHITRERYAANIIVWRWLLNLDQTFYFIFLCSTATQVLYKSSSIMALSNLRTRTLQHMPSQAWQQVRQAKRLKSFTSTVVMTTMHARAGARVHVKQPQ